MIHNISLLLVWSGFLLRSKDVGCFVQLLVQIKTHRVEDRDQNIHQWEGLCLPSRCCLPLSSSSPIKYVTWGRWWWQFLFYPGIFLISEDDAVGTHCSNIILTHYDGDLDVWRIQIPISLLGINFQLETVGTGQEHGQVGRKLLEIFLNNSVKYFNVV